MRQYLLGSFDLTLYIILTQPVTLPSIPEAEELWELCNPLAYVERPWRTTSINVKSIVSYSQGVNTGNREHVIRVVSAKLNATVRSHAELVAAEDIPKSASTI